MKATNKQVARETTQRALAPVIKYVLHGGPSAFRAIWESLNERLRTAANSEGLGTLKRGVTAPQLRGWLHPDPRKRIEPGFGIGTLIIDVWTSVTSAKKKKTP
jgi:hypothetical protein